MNAKELKTKTFSLIEEFYPEEKGLADDEDVKNKINGVINSVLMDLMKYKKIPAKLKYEITDEAKKTLSFSEIDNFYQLNEIRNITYGIIGDLDIKFDVTNEQLPISVDIYYYKYPNLMKVIFDESEDKDKYDEEFEFDLSPEVLEVAPYGIAADLLKNDMISNYGKYFYERYLELKNNIDPRQTKSILTIEGGIDI